MSILQAVLPARFEWVAWAAVPPRTVPQLRRSTARLVLVSSHISECRVADEKVSDVKMLWESLHD